MGDAVVFRFGYFDCFALAKLERFRQWENNGATLLNPTSFILDSKVIMAALQLPAVRQQIAVADATALAILDQSIPETVLLQPAQVARLVQSKDDWVLKFAGFDSGNQAWGGRSLRIGAQHTQAAWRQIIDQFLELPWPVVAQRTVPSACVDIAYGDANNQQQWLRQGTTRLRTFMLRDAASDAHPFTWVGGSHITVSGGTLQVSESTDAVQAPVLFSSDLFSPQFSKLCHPENM